VLLEVDIEVFQRAQAVVLYALEALHGRQMRFEALGFHQRFARQIEQAVQALGGDPQHPFATFGGAFGLFAWRRLALRSRASMNGRWRFGSSSGGASSCNSAMTAARKAGGVDGSSKRAINAT
jgi:hypothetical protein